MILSHRPDVALKSPDHGLSALLPQSRPFTVSRMNLGSPAIHQAVIALGSNMGDRIGYIESALREMNKRGLKVNKTSQLYETKPMYYENQDWFLNGVCQIETDFQPLELLDVLQRIEVILNRKKIIDKGPRTIDLDIILYDSQTIFHERLEIPHRLLREREFVLRPLADILPNTVLPQQGAANTKAPPPVKTILEDLPGKDPEMSAVTVLSAQLPFLRYSDPTRNTHIMAIVNMTPDSFSDGGVQNGKSVESMKHTIKDFISSGATIIDIGGQSTRPGADLLSAEEELSRVLPIVRAIRKMPEAENIAISIDTFYAKVAKETIEAGADIINDISAGLLDKDMLSTVAKCGKTIVLMHMRGDPSTMTKLTKYPDGVVNGVVAELSDRVQAALDAGIPPWRIILDPGIGFAKNQAQNLELLARLSELRNPQSKLAKRIPFPMLLGTSRKGFVGTVTGVKKASQRTWGTAATVTASIAGGADIVRVHDVAEMSQVVKMSDAIYRRKPG